MTLLAPAVAEPAPYTLSLPASWGWLTANQRGGWQRSRDVVVEWRRMAALTATAARLPKMPRAYVIGELRFAPPRRRRDPANWAPTAKAAVDGLVDAGVLDDDDAAHLIGPDMRLGDVSADVSRMVLHIWPLAGAP